MERRLQHFSQQRHHQSLSQMLHFSQQLLQAKAAHLQTLSVFGSSLQNALQSLCTMESHIRAASLQTASMSAHGANTMFSMWKDPMLNKTGAIAIILVAMTSQLTPTRMNVNGFQHPVASRSLTMRACTIQAAQQSSMTHLGVPIQMCTKA